MKLNHKTQMIIAVAVILVFNILRIIFGHWIFRTVGFAISGLLYAIHPVLPEGEEDNASARRFVRFAGIFLILIGIFTR